jgi:glycine cleavage system H lipoate-binding protein
MTQKVYKTANGKTVDMGKLMLQNESTRAVGNMKVNARGDQVDDNNRVIVSKPEQVQRQYQRQTKGPK